MSMEFTAAEKIKIAKITQISLSEIDRFLYINRSLITQAVIDEVNADIAEYYLTPVQVREIFPTNSNLGLRKYAYRGRDAIAANIGLILNLSGTFTNQTRLART